MGLVHLQYAFGLVQHNRISSLFNYGQLIYPVWSTQRRPFSLSVPASTVCWAFLFLYNQFIYSLCTRIFFFRTSKKSAVIAFNKSKNKSRKSLHTWLKVEVNVTNQAQVFYQSRATCWSVDYVWHMSLSSLTWRWFQTVTSWGKKTATLEICHDAIMVVILIRTPSIILGIHWFTE